MEFNEAFCGFKAFIWNVKMVQKPKNLNAIKIFIINVHIIIVIWTGVH